MAPQFIQPKPSCPDDENSLEGIIITTNKRPEKYNVPDCYCSSCEKFLDYNTQIMKKLEDVTLKIHGTKITKKDIIEIFLFGKSKVIYSKEN